jgi:hypothetical protein
MKAKKMICGWAKAVATAPAVIISSLSSVQKKKNV